MRRLTRLGIVSTYADTTLLDAGATDPNVSMLPQATGGGSAYTTVLDPVFTLTPALNPAPAPAPVPTPAYDPIQAPVPAPAPAGASTPAGTIDPSATDNTGTPAPFNVGDFIKANPWLIGLGAGLVILIVSKQRKKRRK